MSGPKCALRYLFGWAVIDILSVIPFDIILLSQPGLQSRLKSNLVRLPRCLKLLRLPRLFRHALLPSIYLHRSLLL
jgi:hypothetical protein